MGVMTETKSLLPPDESMWQKYSPHFEMPLASATSAFLHGSVVGMLVIVTVFSLFAAAEEASRPANMDVVMIEGNGSGFEGLGGEAGLPGSADAGGDNKRTELITPDANPNQADRERPQAAHESLPLLGLPILDDNAPPANGELAIELAKLAKDADDQVKKAMDIPTRPSAAADKKKIGPLGSGNPKGVGGLGGSGNGTGKGNAQGPGIGTGGFGGRKQSQAEIFASRWHFDISGDAKEHARKLAAMGVTLAVPDPKGGFLVVTDLTRRPAVGKNEGLAAYKDAVKWYNTRKESVESLSRELQLPFTPEYVVLLLPKDREQKMANEEKRAADANRRPLAMVRQTLFDFRLNNGAYEPVVIQQK